MAERGFRLSRPIYEALPYVYIVGGLVALAASYFHGSKTWSLVLGLPGLIGVLGGVVVVLRRRDFRQMKADNYFTDDSTRNE
jgi:membrane associated rhomboid family serine protease